MASPNFELSRDADGNVILVPSTTPVSAPRGFFGDVASKAKEYFLPRGSDFTEGTAAAFGAGQDISRRGYENFKTNPLYGAGQVIGGSALSAISPLAGATEYVTKPVGRTFGPAAEHAAEVASMFTPLPSKGASMFKLRPRAGAAAELSNIPREFSYLPRDMQETINAMSPADRNQVFAVLREEAQATAPAAAARTAAPSAASEAVETARSISPVEMAVKQSKYPGRFLHPETGQAQSVFDPLLNQNRPAMGAVHDPFEAITQRVTQGYNEMPNPVDYLTKPRPVVNPDTGYVLRNMEQGPNWGKPRAEWTPGQRVAQGTALVGVPAAAGFAYGNMGQSAPTANAASANVSPTQTAIDAARARQAIDDSDAGSRDAQLRMLVDDRDAGARQSGIAQLAAQNRAAAPIRQRAPIDLTSGQSARPQSGGLASLFSNPISTRELFNRAEANPDDSGAYMRAERQYAATHKDAPSYDLSKLDPVTGMKRGGAANAKPDSLHKALEIIHHLLTRNH